MSFGKALPDGVTQMDDVLVKGVSKLAAEKTENQKRGRGYAQDGQSGSHGWVQRGVGQRLQHLKQRLLDQPITTVGMPS